ncbi:MAG: iron-containing alcohol dehydrogenase [Candidatus Poribacteria bacterium]
MSERTIIFYQPNRLVFGANCSDQFVEDITQIGLKKIFVITTPPVRNVINPLLDRLKSITSIDIWDGVIGEPSSGTFDEALKAYRLSKADAVVGVGGGSVLDISKIVPALNDSDQDIQSAYGIGNVKCRKTYLVCLPTTAGTGSEVSPNSIIIDKVEGIKKGIISPYLVPDASYVDPMLTLTVPPNMTASTGMDALTHCIESYANLFAHPITDMYAIEGIKLISANLKKAFDDGNDTNARTNMALGSLYGGFCLGPVNTGAAHALAYPLGSDFHIPHGLANSLMLPYVYEFNLTAMPDRYAKIALALGAKPTDTDNETAKMGLEIIKKLCQDCQIPLKLSKIGVPFSAIEKMAKSAMTVTRLLKNNPRPLQLKDAIEIYEKAYI